MKEYETWEIVKMLTENPNLKFKRPLWDKSCLGSNGGSLQIFSQETGKATYSPENTTIHVSMADDWTLIPQPVPWQEALQARLDGKTVKVDCPDCGGDADSCVFEPTQDKESVCFSALKEGTFYIIEAPID